MTRVEGARCAADMCEAMCLIAFRFLKLKHNWPEGDIAAMHLARSQGRRPPGESQTAPRAGFWVKLGASLEFRAMVADINRAELRWQSHPAVWLSPGSVRCGNVCFQPMMSQVQTETL